MDRSNDGSAVAILKNNASRLLPNADDDIHHCPGQVVGPNDLIGEQHAKNRVDRAQQAVAQIRFFAWLQRIDICGSEDIDAGKTGGVEGVLCLSLVSCETHPPSSRRIRSPPPQHSKTPSR